MLGQASEDQNPLRVLSSEHLYNKKKNDGMLGEGGERLFDLHCIVKCVIPIVSLSLVPSVRSHEYVTNSKINKTVV